MERGLAQAIEEFIRDKAARSGGREYSRPPLVGFSDAGDPMYDEVVRIVGPPNRHPREIMPSARGIVSFFVPFRKEVVDSNRGPGPVSETWLSSYLAVNEAINDISRSLASLLASQGLEARAAPATHDFDLETLKAGWSHRSAALVAGLGRFGLNRMLITRLGCAGRYGTVFTSAVLPRGSRPSEEPCRFRRDGGCRACLKACPVSSLGADGFDRFKCHGRLQVNKELFADHTPSGDVCGKCVVAGPCAYREI
ncbi:MAG: epoxyqueuosine reductase [Deltaproteobacteria bacterium]|nr:epoxyqueuosine reductase [Deltaproteobacteria bacterium]